MDVKKQHLKENKEKKSCIFALSCFMQFYAVCTPLRLAQCQKGHERSSRWLVNIIGPCCRASLLLSRCLFSLPHSHCFFVQQSHTQIFTDPRVYSGTACMPSLISDSFKLPELFAILGEDSVVTEDWHRMRYSPQTYLQIFNRQALSTSAAQMSEEQMQFSVGSSALRAHIAVYLPLSHQCRIINLK